jgi:DNA-binding NtrC family response regulator
VKVDVRVLAATNVDIKYAIAAKKLREDLFYRLSTVVLHIPPLRERREDIPVLLQYYLGRFAVRHAIAPRPLSSQALEFCMRYDWPGNVRELENFTKRYLILGEEALSAQTLEAEDAGNGTFRNAAEPQKVGQGDLKSTLRTLKDGAERLAINRALQETHWNRREAAGLLNISYKTMLNKIRQHSIDERLPTDLVVHDAAAEG